MLLASSVSLRAENKGQPTVASSSGGTVLGPSNEGRISWGELAAFCVLRVSNFPTANHAHMAPSDCWWGRCELQPATITQLKGLHSVCNLIPQHAEEETEADRQYGASTAVRPGIENSLLSETLSLGLSTG